MLVLHNRIDRVEDIATSNRCCLLEGVTDRGISVGSECAISTRECASVADHSVSQLVRLEV